MGIVYSIDADAAIVRLEFTSAVDADTWAATLEAVLSHTLYRRGFGFLVDRRQSTTPTMEYVESGIGVTLQHESELSGVRWAIVVPPGPTRGMLERGITLAKSIPLAMPAEIFDDMQSAENWLRITAPRKAR